MSVTADILDALRAADPAPGGVPREYPLGAGLAARGVAFVAEERWERRWHEAIAELAECVRPVGGDPEPILTEGGVYPGAWLESTATISAEVVDRFAPEVTRATHLRLARAQRDDGLLPYKVTDFGSGFSQIQMVTPLARCVWRHHQATGGGDLAYLREMYRAMSRMDVWLSEHRDTRGSGGVEAFCTFDTGHDASPRFWFAPNRCPDGDAAIFDGTVAGLPYIAPDLTANVACQREHLGRISAALGEAAAPWSQLAEGSWSALLARCCDGSDGLFYDLDATESFVRVRSDVLMRVLACQPGARVDADALLASQLMNTRGFLTPHGWTSIALDDPRFNPDYQRNSWGGPINMLTMLRAPDAFEGTSHVAELALVETGALAALARADRFPQCLDPFSGDAGFTECYSPALLFFLDALERTCGILPRPNGSVWLSALPPTRLTAPDGPPPTWTGHTRRIRGTRYELACADDEAIATRDGELWLRWPRGWRVELNRDGEVAAVTGLAATPVEGELEIAGRVIPLALVPNERVTLRDGAITGRAGATFIPPQY
ncbi:MAG: hypothetical protein LBM23_02260 [Propionibacteriaceae bacterium]|jgi:hypothetical protein|nr:hypothetical protein [Propionibacteriaceae bacterium]